MFLQRSINKTCPANLSVDGKIGIKTISEANSNNPKTVLDHFIEERKKYYNSIVTKNPSQKKFLKGWLNRVEEVNKYIDNARTE